MGSQGPSYGHRQTKGWASTDQGTGIYCPCAVHRVPKGRTIFGQTESKIIVIRNTQVILDRDVAELYGVETRDINKAVKNNPKKFPPGYVIELNNSEKQELVENFHRFNSLKHSTVAPHAFTEQGLYMLATILKGDLAISTTIAIIDTFTKLCKLTFGVNLGVLKFSIETTRESKE